MGDFQQVILAVTQVFTVVNLSVIFGGLVLGMIVGCIPGLSVTLGIILLLPLTYSFSSPDTAIISLLAVYVGGMYGGSISAITLNTPGTNSAIATTFDGYPLAKKGKVKKALDTSLFASVFGGLFSAILLLVCASFITKLVSRFASVEYFSMAILGISLIAGVSGDSLPKGIMSGLLGILMAAIGSDAVTGVMRFTFGIDALKYGIDMLPAMIALIALTQVVQKLRDFVLAEGQLDDVTKLTIRGLRAGRCFPSFRHVSDHLQSLLFSVQCRVSEAVLHSSCATTSAAELPNVHRILEKEVWRVSRRQSPVTTRLWGPL